MGAGRSLLCAALLGAGCLAGPGTAQPFGPLPYAATAAFDETESPDSYDFPTGPAEGRQPPPMARAEGRITRRAWQVTGANTTLQLLSPLREALLAEGWEILLDCKTRACGGFNFRFAIEVLPAPAMNVDLFDFRALSARRGDERLLLLISRGAGTGFVQMVHAGPAGPSPLPAPGTEPGPIPGPAIAADPLPQSPPGDPEALLPHLLTEGRAVLEDLRFATGATELADETPASLTALAALLTNDPSLRLLLVGHTDSEGDLETNRALSQRRAEAVRQRLITLGAAQERIEAHGVGYLAPRAPNTTEEGRRANRRVEAVLLPAGA